MIRQEPKDPRVAELGALDSSLPSRRPNALQHKLRIRINPYGSLEFTAELRQGLCLPPQVRLIDSRKFVSLGREYECLGLAYGEKFFRRLQDAIKYRKRGVCNRCAIAVLSPRSTSKATHHGPVASFRSNETTTFMGSTAKDAVTHSRPETSHVNGTFEWKDSAMNCASDCIVRAPTRKSHSPNIALSICLGVST
jgi:hypothetical protein